MTPVARLLRARPLSRLLTSAVATVAVLLLAGSAQAAPIRAGSWVWYYQKVSQADATKFTGAGAVVVADQSDDTQAVQAIHDKGALAFHYVNMYWYPLGRAYEGIDLSAHPDWEFCASGSNPLLGRVQNGVRWYSVDLNEQAVTDALHDYLVSLKTRGYDGVFFDHGSDAFGTGSLPHTVSTCTADPVRPGATYADAFARIVKDASAMGLHVVVNYGASTRPLRRDVYDITDRVMVETAPHTGGAGFAWAFARDRAEEAAARRGIPRYVQEIKTTALGQRQSAFFQWAQVALWRIDLTVNSGDDGCAGVTSGTTCWHYGTFPELTEVKRGNALDSRPIGLHCQRGSTTRCLWLRHWQDSLVMVNMTGRAITASVTPGSARCRMFTDVWNRAQLANGTCTRRVRVVVPAYSGRVYTETAR